MYKKRVSDRWGGLLENTTETPQSTMPFFKRKIGLVSRHWVKKWPLGWCTWHVQAPQSTRYPLPSGLVKRILKSCPSLRRGKGPEGSQFVGRKAAGRRPNSLWIYYATGWAVWAKAAVWPVVWKIFGNGVETSEGGHSSTSPVWQFLSVILSSDLFCLSHCGINFIINTHFLGSGPFFESVSNFFPVQFPKIVRTALFLLTSTILIFLSKFYPDFRIFEIVSFLCFFFGRQVFLPFSGFIHLEVHDSHLNEWKWHISKVLALIMKATGVKVLNLPKETPGVIFLQGDLRALKRATEVLASGMLQGKIIDYEPGIPFQCDTGELGA